jgi:Pin2-interacting protein X1
MTIVSGPEQRNSDWANDTSSFGQKMLLKMGWTQGKGLGKSQQGTSTNLRAIRREEGLGLGASTDKTGDLGFSVTSRNFHGVLASLKEHHGSAVDSQSSATSKKSKKSKSKSLKRSESGLTMPSNRVTAGHARKMREAKDLNSKSKEDMAAVFGMKIEQYQQNSVWGRLSSLGDSGVDSSSSENEEKKSKKEKKKKSKKSKESGENKRKKTSDENDDDNFVQEKKKNKKSKKQK